MSDDRMHCLSVLQANCHCELVVVTPDNLAEYLLPHAPLHPAYEYLSYTHKADYLRCYFMHFHGGGYSDIKAVEFSWDSYFDWLNEETWMVGYKEKHQKDVAFPPGRKDEVHSQWQKAVGICAFIVKPQTPLTQRWYDSLQASLDSHLQQLRKHPATNPQDKYLKASGNWLKKILKIGRSPYPLRWAEILGEILHPLTIEYHQHINQGLPRPNFSRAYR